VRKLSVRTVPSNSEEEEEEDVPPPPPPPDVALAAAESSAQLTLVVLLLLLLVPVLLFDVLGKGHPCSSRYVWAARQLVKLLPKLMNTFSMVVEVQVTPMEDGWNLGWERVVPRQPRHHQGLLGV
jgi:hypothetical protein